MGFSSFVSGGLGSLVGTVGSLIGGSMDASNSRDLAKMGYAEQRNVLQNQYQWKAADAKKAGLHPLAVIGSGSYSMSPMSVPGTDYASVLGKMGESIGDAANAYMNKDQIAAKVANSERREEEQHDANMRESAARTLMYNGQALEATRRAATYSVPMATGREIINGQTQADAPRKFERYVNPDGSLSGRLPTEQYQGIYDDKPGLEYKPGIEALYWDARDWLADKFGVWDFRGTRGSY